MICGLQKTLAGYVAYILGYARNVDFGHGDKVVRCRLGFNLNQI